MSVSWGSRGPVARTFSGTERTRRGARDAMTHHHWRLSHQPTSTRLQLPPPPPRQHHWQSTSSAVYDIKPQHYTANTAVDVFLFIHSCLVWGTLISRLAHAAAIGHSFRKYDLRELGSIDSNLSTWSAHLHAIIPDVGSRKRNLHCLRSAGDGLPIHLPEAEHVTRR
jgi:hypothetical protein